jgi:CBS domain-containing protein
VSVTVKKSTLGGLLVGYAMRKEVVRLAGSASIATAVRQLIKHKINALLVTDTKALPVGVVSKTDIAAAYYAALPVDSPIEQIMMSPPLFCLPDDPLESALQTMRSQGVYRLYVREENSDQAIGVLAYPDIVGLLYRFCYTCDKSVVNRSLDRDGEDAATRIRMRDVMVQSVASFPDDASLAEIMEGLSAYRFGAVLITDRDNRPCGVVSKTDLIRAYARGVPSEVPAREILASEHVISCDEDQFIEDAIRTMIFTERQRLFVHKDTPDRIVGVFSLSDAARVRSGSCKACVSSRIRVEDNT